MIVATGLSAGLLSVPALGSTSRPHQPRLLATLEKETATRAKWGLQSDQPYLARIAARSDLQLSSVGAHVTPEESRELARRWRISEKMASVMAYARRALGRAYAGAYVDQTRGGQVVVRGTAPTFSVRPLKALLPPGTDVVYRPSIHGWQQLRALQAAIEKDFSALAREGIMVTAVGSVASTDKVEIAVSPESRQDAEAILASRYGEAVEVSRQGAVQAQGRQPDAAVHEGEVDQLVST